MASAGTLTVDLNANTARLRSDFTKAAAMTKKYERQSIQVFKAVGRAVFSLKGVIAGLVGGGGLTALIKTSIEYGDTLAKTSDKLGVTVEALQELRFAAELTGVPVKALDIGIQRFTRRIGEAAQGSGVLKDVFGDLGIELRNVDGTMRSTENILYDYADAIQNAESSQQQLLLAFKAFDTEGAALVNTLRDGSAGLRDLRQQAQDTGSIMSSVMTESATVINDRWTVLTNTIGNKFKIAALTAVDSAMNLFGVFNNLGDVQGRLLKIQDTLLEAEIRRDQQIGRNKKATSNRIAALKEEQAELQKLVETLTKARMARERIAGLDTSGLRGGGVSGSSGGMEAASKPLSTTGGGAGGGSGGSTGFASNSAFEAEFQAAINLEDQLDVLHAEREAVRAEQDAENARLWGDLWVSTANNVSQGIGDAFADALIEQKNMGEALKSLMKSVAKSVISGLVQIAIKRTLLAAKGAAEEKVIVLSGMTSAKALATAWAPAAALASLATSGGNSAPAMAGITATNQLAASFALLGQAHDGMDYVPREGSYNLQKGEMVLDPGTSQQVRDNAVGGSNNLSVTVLANDAESFAAQQNRNAENIWNILLDKMQEEGRSFA